LRKKDLLLTVNEPETGEILKIPEIGSEETIYASYNYKFKI